MKIIMIRHEKVDMAWDSQYDSASYDLACKKYDDSSIITEAKPRLNTKNMKRIYISGLSRTYQTANKLFGDGDFFKTPLINEVPLKSFKDTKHVYPVWVWNIASRLQWFFQNKRQAETREETIARAREFIELLEKRQEDCYVITHGFYMRVLTSVLKKRRYHIERKPGFGIDNLDNIVARK